jgi:hypothetical protein
LPKNVALRQKAQNCGRYAIARENKKRTDGRPAGPVILGEDRPLKGKRTIAPQQMHCNAQIEKYSLMFSMINMILRISA